MILLLRGQFASIKVNQERVGLGYFVFAANWVSSVERDGEVGFVVRLNTS